MAEDRLDPNVSPDAEPDVAAANSDVQIPTKRQLSRDELIRRTKIFLPPELKVQHADLLIVFAEDNRRDAMKLKEVVNKLEFPLGNGEVVRARALLQDEAAVYVRSEVEWLQHALEICTLICFLFTDKFITDPVLKEMANASFWETVIDPEKHECFIPMYPYLQDLPPKALSSYFEQRKSLKMYQPGWEKHINEVISFRLESRLKREEDQREKQIEYIDSHKHIHSILEGSSSLRPSAAENDASIVHQTVYNSNMTSRYHGEFNLDAHANDVTFATASRTEPDGIDHNEATAAVGSSAVTPSPEAEATRYAASVAENIDSIILFAITVGIGVVALVWG